MKENEAVKHFNNAQLVKQFQETGCESALSELYSRYNGKVLHYCTGLVHDKILAADLAQEVFLRMIEHLVHMRQPELFEAWLFRIARNLSLDLLKEKSRGAKELTEAQYNLVEETFDIEEALSHEQSLEKLNELLKEAPPELRELLLARYYHKVPIKQLQQKMGLSESAIKMRLARARKYLARQYTGHVSSRKIRE